MTKNFKEIESRIEKCVLAFADYKETLYNIIGGSRAVFDALYDDELYDATQNMADYGINYDDLKDTEIRLNESLGL